jgi:MotA/TolQ/ExbB proton channel family
MTAAIALQPPEYRPRRGAVLTAGGLGAAMFFAGLLITLIQLYYTIHYLEAVVARTDVELVKNMIPHWSRPYMVDLALVAPGLFGFTGACMARAAWMLVNGSVEVIGETFPFPRRCRTYYVQHGLLGTVIGFVIGFANLNAKDEQAPVVMLAALSAALWSTLMAIALAYFFCPIVESIYQRALMVTADRVPASDPLEVLDRRAAAACRALASLTETVGKVDQGLGLQALSLDFIALRKELSAAAQKLVAAEGRINWLEEQLADRTAQIHSLGTAADTFERSGKDAARKIDELSHHFNQRNTRIDGETAAMKERLETLETAQVQDRQQRRAELARAIKTGAALIERLRRGLEG